MTKIKIMDSASGYDLAAGRYDDKEKYLNSFEKNQLRPLWGDLRGKRVLDVGAGTGRVVAELSKDGGIVTALDISTQMLERLKIKKLKNVKTVVGDAESLPFANNTFDLVVATFLVVHLKDPTRFFDEVYRVLKDGGKFIVTNINQKEPPEVKTDKGVIKIESYYHRPDKIRELLGELAFGIEREITVKEKEVWVNQIIVAVK